MLVVETPAFGSSRARVRVRVDARGLTADDAGPEARTVVLETTPARVVGRAAPTKMSAGGGATTTLFFDEDVARGEDVARDEDVAHTSTSSSSLACWIGTVGPISARRGSEVGAATCASPAKAPGRASPRLARGDAADAGLEGATVDVVAPSVASREMLRAVAVVGVGGEARVWSPVAVGERTRSRSARERRRTPRRERRRGGEATTTFRGLRAGFVAVAAAKQAHAGSAPFAHIHVRVAPGCVSAPSATRASGGGVAWLSGADATDAGGGVVGGGGEGGSRVDVARRRARVLRARVVETPACAIGSGTLALAVGRGGGADVVVDATLATTFLPEAFGSTRDDAKDWSLESSKRPSARVGGVETAIRPDGGMVTLVGVGFRDSGGASCRFGPWAPRRRGGFGDGDVVRDAASRRRSPRGGGFVQRTRTHARERRVPPRRPRAPETEGIVPTAIPARDAA